MTPERYYLDTSAYLSIVLGESGGEKLSREVRGGELLSSSLLVLEAGRNLIRLSRSGHLSPDDLQSALDRLDEDTVRITLRDLTLDLCSHRVFPIVSTPRSLDLVHLRTALWFHQSEPIRRFVSLDAAQNLAARELGLPVY